MEKKPMQQKSILESQAYRKKLKTVKEACEELERKGLQRRTENDPVQSKDE